jgi:hypothetical protein
MSDVFSTFCDRLAKAALVGASTVYVALGSWSDGVSPAQQHRHTSGQCCLEIALMPSGLQAEPIS